MEKYEDFVKDLDLIEILKDINDDDKKLKIIKTIRKMIKILKKFYKSKYKNMEWSSLISEFYKDKDILRRFILIHEVVTQKYICKNRKCTIFPDLEETAKVIDALEYYNIKDVKKKFGKESITYIEYKSRLEEISIDLTKVFQEVYKLSVISNTQRNDIQDAHKRQITTIHALGKAGVPYSNKLLGLNVDNSIKDDEKILRGDDPALNEKKDLFKKKEKKVKAKSEK